MTSLTMLLYMVQAAAAPLFYISLFSVVNSYDTGFLFSFIGDFDCVTGMKTWLIGGYICRE